MPLCLFLIVLFYQFYVIVCVLHSRKKGQEKKQTIGIFCEDPSEKQETNSCSVGRLLPKQKYALWAMPVM